MVDLHDTEDEDGGDIAPSPVVLSSKGATSSIEGFNQYSERESPIFEPPDLDQQRLGNPQEYVSSVVRPVRHHQRRSMASASHDPASEFSVSSDSYSSSRTESAASSSVLFGEELNISSFENLVDDLQRSLSLRRASTTEDGKGIRSESRDNSLVDKQKKTPYGGDSAASSISSDTVTTITSSSPSSASTTAGLRKWFQVNYHTLKQKNHLKAGFKSLFRESRSKKLMLHQQATPGLSTAGSSSESGSDLEGDTDSDDTCNPERPLARASVGVTETESVGRNRHSFSHHENTRNKQSTQGSANKASSWEIEKGVTNSSAKVMLYCTSIRTDVDVYEDCIAVKSILTSLVGASFDERSISEHPEYELELKSALNVSKISVPSVCVAGKYFVGIDNIMQVYKKGILGSLLLEVLPHGLKPEALCTCRAGKFLICPLCKGKCKLTRKGQEAVPCKHCSGTGLLKCPNCLYA